MEPVPYPLTINQIVGALSLVLEGSALPAQGVGLSAELRMHATYYPGVAAPSTQIMGTQEGDITFRGVWRDDWLNAAGGAQVLLQEARALLIGQGRCILTWGPNVVRYGFVKRFQPTILRESVIEWEMVFYVDQANESAVISVPTAPTPTALSLATIIAAIQIGLDAVYTAAVSINNVARAVT